MPSPPRTTEFSELALIEPLLRAVAAEGYETPTPIQQAAIPHVLAGRDVLGCAQTGTGKTAAFALPILQRLVAAGPVTRGPRHSRVLVLTPTRELATQIGDSFATYGRHTPLRHTVVFGGIGQNPQVRALRAGVDILVATPGRLLDLLGQGLAHLEQVEVFVLDEADRMLDMGFIHDVRRVIDRLPTRRQTLLFSATMPAEIRSLAGSILVRPVQVGGAAPVSAAADNIDQSLYFVEKADKRALLAHLLGDRSITRALVFTRTKHAANRVTEHLRRAGVGAGVIHGNKSQGARERALADFKAGRARVLVATDIAARGIDIEDISHVINFDLPNIAESYVHRIGRTARAGAAGIALSFCDTAERESLPDLERLLHAPLRVVLDHPFRSPLRPPAPAPVPSAAAPSRPRGPAVAARPTHRRRRWWPRSGR
ncbi:MAG: DEAD/DEAH box helicase [Deltaproteobacteria bacterium]|nr:DEAD/DEAH box helicase [Deltaproteobacteria bacterium]